MRARFKNDAASIHPHSPLVGSSSPPATPRPRRRFIFLAALCILVATTALLLSPASKAGNADLTYLKTSPSLSHRLQSLQHDNSTDRSLASRQSLGFFTDISPSTWKGLQLKAASIQPNTRGDPLHPSPPSTWWQQHYEPEFACQYERRIGRSGDGGKWICDPHRIQSSGCLVYSIGSNGDASFEAAVLQDIGRECEIHVFDYGDFEDSVSYQTSYSKNVHYHSWGIGGSESGGKFKTLEETARLLNHTGRTVDIFKIDCEGCELDTFPNWLDADLTLRQIAVEIHPVMTMFGARMKLPQTVELFERLKEEGYVITHKEPNVQFAQLKLCVEYNFLKLSKEFWNLEEV